MAKRRTVWMTEDMLPDLDDWMSPNGDPLCWPDRECAEMNASPSESLFEVHIIRHDRAGRQVPRWLVHPQPFSDDRGFLLVVEKYMSPLTASAMVLPRSRSVLVDGIEAESWDDAVRKACDILADSDEEDVCTYEQIMSGIDRGTWTKAVHTLADEQEMPA